MANDNRESLIIKNTDISLDDVSLGKYIEGYSNTRDKFPSKFLWWLLFPVFGWIIVLTFTVMYCLTKLFNTKHYIYIFSEGVLWKTKKLFGKKNLMIRFNKIGKINISKTRYFAYGIIYQRTEMNFEILDDTNKKIKKISISYRNKNEEIDGYNSMGFALHRIYEIWGYYKQQSQNTIKNHMMKSQGFSGFQI